MNKIRRQSLAEVLESIEIAKDNLEQIKEEEETARDNLPESLQNSDRYMQMDENCANLDYAISSLDETIDYINNIE